MKNSLFMKILKIIGFVVVYLGVVCSAYGQSDTLNRTDKFGKKYGRWEKYENGKLLWKADFYNGEPVGAFVHYYPNKKVKDSLYYHPNSPKVNAVTYHSNGAKASEGMFINKNKDGKWLYYNESGKLFAEEHYVSGMKQGVWKMFSTENGLLLQEETWDKNKRNGEYKEYYTTGDIRLKWHYKNGKIDGDYASYYLDGTLWNKGQYTAGLREGTWTNYDREGNELKIEEFTREHVTRTVLGFKTPAQWLKLDASKIAYFYQNAGNNIFIQLWDGKKIMLDDKNSLVNISNTAGVELFIFINEDVLSSYEAIRKVTETEQDEAEVTLKPAPSFKVYSYDNYYKMLKALLNPDAPTND
jgi:antitoxin component YwqK of YwqJK toxin-antitoxin module